MGTVLYLKQLLKIVATPPPCPKACGELKNAQSGGAISTRGIESPCFNQVSEINKKSNECDVNKSFRIKYVFDIDQAFTKAILAVVVQADC